MNTQRTDGGSITERLPAAPWQPIKTAPKDGTQVLLWAESWEMSWGIQIGHFEFDEWQTSEGSVADNDEDFDPGAEVFDESSLDLDRNTGPTHWMPLPAPPTGETKMTAQSNLVEAVPDLTAPLCERCGARVHDPCDTAEKQAGCQLPDFCFPDRTTGATP